MNETIGPREGAALVMAWLERKGARFTLDADNHFHCDLNGCSDVTTKEEAERLSEMVFALRDPIREILIAQRVRH